MSIFLYPLIPLQRLSSRYGHTFRREILEIIEYQSLQTQNFEPL